jgi:DNA-binding response OmpR family regulator
MHAKLSPPLHDHTFDVLVSAVALTATRTEDRTMALRAGFDVHLTKPIEPAELLVVIATLVEGVKRRRGSRCRPQYA